MPCYFNFIASHIEKISLVRAIYLIQPFASYRLTLLVKLVLKSYNYIVCPLKLFVLTLSRRVGGAKTISYGEQTIYSFAVKFKSYARY